MNLQREVLHVPLYGWLAGAGALLLSIIYFAKHGNTAKTAASGTSPRASSVPGDPQNIYSSTNIYTQPGANPGNAQVSPPPGRQIPPAVPPFHRPQPLPVYGPVVPPTTRGSDGSGIGGAMLPLPVNPVHWQPRMNSDIFGPPADGTSPVAPVIAWNMQPTAAYTQA